MNVIILSRQASLYSTSRLALAARRHGHQVHVVNPLTCPVGINCEPAGAQECLSIDSPAIIPRIGASITEFGCALVRRLEQAGAWVLNSAVGIAQSRDKLLSMQLLHGCKLPVPRTAVVGQYSGLPRAIDAVGGLPVVLKLRRGTQGKGVVLVRTLAAARRAFSVMNDFQQYTLVQEFIQEAHSRDIRIIVVGQSVVAAMERQAPRGDFRANLHRGGTARNYLLDDQMKTLAIQAARIHNLGFAGVDLLMTARGPVVIEVNSSPGLQGIETATRVDVAGAVIEHMESAREKRLHDERTENPATTPIPDR